MKSLLVAFSVYLFHFVSSNEIPQNLTEQDENARIVGGNRANVPIPYQVSFQIKSRQFFDIAAFSIQEYAHFCGGSIISENHIVTAAHCVAGIKPNKFTIYSGSSQRTTGGTRHRIEKIFIHPDYQELVKCDIAVIKVADPFKLDGIKRDKIDFSDTQEVGGNVPVTLTGWGFAYPTPLAIPYIDTLPNYLQALNYTTVTNAECKEVGFNVTDTEICAYSRILKGACSGDSGGPLVNAERTKLIGIVSYGTQICSAGVPDAYTRVSKFVDWINEQMKK